MNPAFNIRFNKIQDWLVRHDICTRSGGLTDRGIRLLNSTRFGRPGGDRLFLTRFGELRWLSVPSGDGWKRVRPGGTRWTDYGDGDSYIANLPECSRDDLDRMAGLFDYSEWDTAAELLDDDMDTL